MLLIAYPLMAAIMFVCILILLVRVRHLTERMDMLEMSTGVLLLGRTKELISTLRKPIKKKSK